jgi:hypothetical protein
MGWWGYGILDGDQPQDQLHNVGEDCKTKFTDKSKKECFNYHYPFTKEKVEEGIPNMMKRDDPIYFHVAALVIMHYGVELPKKLQTKIIKSINYEIKGCINFTDPLERKKHLTNLLTMVQKYEAPTRWGLDEDNTFQVLTPNTVRFIKDDHVPER